MTTKRPTFFFLVAGRLLLALAFLALLVAWFAGFTGGPALGLSQQHLFNDALALALLGIGCQVDAAWHARET